MNKAAILTTLRQVLSDKREALNGMIADLQQGLAEDTKSSAGDKYETSREMSNQELEKLGVQLAEINRQLVLLGQLETTAANDRIQTGSYVETDTGHFLIGIPAGSISVNGTTIYCISAGAPAAQVLLNRSTDDTVSLNGKALLIRSIQ